jgi:hypothetical protein
MTRYKKLGGISQTDIVNAKASTEKICDEYKTRHYKTICKSVASKFANELSKMRGGTISEILQAANAVDADCARYKGRQYRSVCERSVAKFIGELRHLKPEGLAGRKQGRK